MADDSLTTEERDDLVRRAFVLNGQRFPAPGAPAVSEDDFYQFSNDFYLAVGNYFDRLPRVVMSACPYCAEPLVQAFDPWGVDGLWWGVDRICTFDEPAPCEHFQALLGALRVDEASLPADMLMESQPGPEVPFVVPRLLGLSNMIVVVGELAMQRGGPAYPVAYYSDTQIEPLELHQNWCRNVHWFDQNGQEGWTYANDPWEFDLDPFVQSDQLRWVTLAADDAHPKVHRASDGAACPFVGLPGERQKQLIAGGKRSFLPLPDGTPVEIFEERP